jgi:Mg2+ and Co2+ transporter CorA
MKTQLDIIEEKIDECRQDTGELRHTLGEVQQDIARLQEKVNTLEKSSSRMSSRLLDLAMYLVTAVLGALLGRWVFGGKKE